MVVGYRLGRWIRVVLCHESLRAIFLDESDHKKDL